MGLFDLLTDGNLALAVRADTAPVKVATAPLPAISIESAALALRTAAADPFVCLDATARRIVDQKFLFVDDVLRARQQFGLSEEQAVLQVGAARGAEYYPDLRQACKLNFTNYRKWRGKCGVVRGRADPDGKQNLIPQYTAGAAKRKAQLDLHQTFKTDFFQAVLNENDTQIKKAWRLAYEGCIQKGIPRELLPDYHQVQYWIKTRIKGTAWDRGRLGATEYRRVHAAHALRNWDCEPGEVFISDHRILDLWVRVPHPTKPGEWLAVRPWCTLWMDAKSEYVLCITLYTDASPSHERILEGLYNAIMANGGRPCRMIITDCGKDYKKRGAFSDLRLLAAKSLGMEVEDGDESANDVLEGPDSVLGDVKIRGRWDATRNLEYTHSIVRELGIKVKLCDPHQPQQKPVERLFAEFAAEIDRFCPGYCGYRFANRPEEDEFKGDPRRLLTEQQLRDLFNAFLPRWHARENESRVTGGRARGELWAARRELREAWPIARLQMAMLLPLPRTVKVATRGVSMLVIRHHGWEYIPAGDPDDPETYLQNADALYAHQGEEVMLKTSWAIPAPVENGKRYPLLLPVFTLDGKYIATVEPAEEVNVFHPTERQRECLGKVKHIIAHARKKDADLVNSLRKSIRQVTGNLVREVYQIAAPTSTATISALQDDGKVRAKRLQDPGADSAAQGTHPSGTGAPAAGVAPDPDVMARLDAFLSSRADDATDISPDPEVAARLRAKFEYEEEEEQT